MNTKMLWSVVLAGVAASGSPVRAQERPVSLAEAVVAARAGSQDVLAARARAEAAEHGRAAAGAFRWPTVGLEAGAIRSDDPVAAFGGRLRQGRFSQADFDPAGLNHPDPLTDWSGALGVGWAPLNFSADAGLRAAAAEAEAAGLGAAWAERAAGFRAEARYIEAVGAERRLAAAMAALGAAEANARLAQRRRDEGVLMDADVLQARAALEGARAGEIDARRGVADARDRLAVALGWPAGPIPVPTDTAFAAPPTTAVEVSGRLDLRASEAALRASEARVLQARRSRLPRLEGFARLATHSSDVLSGAERDLTVGFQVRVPVFTGSAIRSQERAAASLRDAAALDHDLRSREAQAQAAEAARPVEAARQGAAAASAAAEAATEAARLMRRRFEEGLITMADLLGVEAQAAALANQAVNAALGLHLAAARLAFLTDTTHDITEDDITGGDDR
ncbi:MAG: TolC family protein [Longimicrobiales bacterium]|nr:TolC family protein [Longimicrobiales bacterium]